MANTTTEILTVDGVTLNTYAKNIESIAGRLRRPPRRTQNVVVPARHGALWTPNKKFDVGIIALPMWVRGTDDNGAVSTTSRRHFYANVDALSELFSSDVLMDVRHTLPDGTIRQVMAEVLDVLDVNVNGHGGDQPIGKFGVSMTAPYPFWQDVATTTQTFTPVGTSFAMSLTSFAAATAPMEDMTVVITGPCNNPYVDTGYTRFTYGANLAAGNILTVNCDLWTLVGSGGLTASEQVFTHTGDARWCVIPSTQPGTPPSVTFGATGGVTGATRCAFTGRLKYLVG